MAVALGFLGFTGEGVFSTSTSTSLPDEDEEDDELLLTDDVVVSKISLDLGTIVVPVCFLGGRLVRFFPSDLLVGGGGAGAGTGSTFCRTRFLDFAALVGAGLTLVGNGLASSSLLSESDESFERGLAIGRAGRDGLITIGAIAEDADFFPLPPDALTTVAGVAEFADFELLLLLTRDRFFFTWGSSRSDISERRGSGPFIFDKAEFRSG